MVLSNVLLRHTLLFYYHGIMFISKCHVILGFKLLFDMLIYFIAPAGLA